MGEHDYALLLLGVMWIVAVPTITYVMRRRLRRH